MAITAIGSTKAMMGIVKQAIENSGDILVVKPKSHELINAEETVSKEEIERYKKTFKEAIVKHCISNNYIQPSEKYLEDFDKITQAEYDAQLESVGFSEMDFDSPEDDARKCVGYWD